MRTKAFSINFIIQKEPLKLTVIIPIEHPFIPPRHPVDNLSRELTFASTDGLVLLVINNLLK